MPNDNTALVRRTFGPHAEKYARSAAFATGEGLTRMLEAVDPRPDWTALDVATGGGHTALALARRVRRVVAADLTPEMLIAARALIEDGGLTGVAYCEADAQALPFARGAFDLVTCRIAPHHFPDVGRFVRECARSVKPGGTVAIIDGIVPPEPFTARYLNAYEKLRDPSHYWQYSAAEWQGFFASAGLELKLAETFRRAYEFQDYCDRLDVPAADRLRLQALLRQAPAGPKAALAPFDRDGQLWFHLGEILIVGAAW